MKQASIFRFGLAIVALGALSGCGTYTPDIREAWGQLEDEQKIVNAIVRRIRCEIREAVNSVLDDDIRNWQQGLNSERQLKWLETWGAQVTLTLTMDEKTNLNPGAVFNTPMIGAKTLFPGGISVPASQSYTLGLGGKFASTATRIDKINWFYLVSKLRQEHPEDRSCKSHDMPGSYLIVESDLKLKEWLSAAVTPGQTEEISFPDSKNKDVISHQIKFVIDTSGDITPTWRLVRITANGGGAFFGAGRSRTQDLTITLGPTIPAPGGSAPAAPKQKKETPVAVIPSVDAQNAHLASQIGLSVANNLNNVPQ